MKFEMTDLRQQISNTEIINDLRIVANNLGKQSLKMREYCKENGAKYNYQTAKKRFGNWENVLKKAGLETEKSIHGIEYGETSIKEELLIADMARVAKELDNPKITSADYDKFGQWSSVTIIKRFGGWNKAKKKAQLEVGRAYNTSTEEFLENILGLWTLLGRQPKYSEVISPNSKFHGTSYANKFGSWKAALEKFIEYVNSESEKEIIDDVNTSQVVELNEIKTTGLQQKEKKIKIKRTPRGINLRLRWIVLKRDNFSCKKCGRSPAKDPTIILHVDHVTPWSKEGEPVVENLETLCEQCNLGKSNIL